MFFFFLKILCHGFIINIVLLRFNYSYILFYNYQSLVNFTIKKKEKRKIASRVIIRRNPTVQKF